MKTAEKFLQKKIKGFSVLYAKATIKKFDDTCIIKAKVVAVDFYNTQYFLTESPYKPISKIVNPTISKNE